MTVLVAGENIEIQLQQNSHSILLLVLGVKLVSQSIQLRDIATSSCMCWCELLLAGSGWRVALPVGLQTYQFACTSIGEGYYYVQASEDSDNDDRKSWSRTAAH